MLKELLKPEIQELIEQNDWQILKEALSPWPAPDIADLLINLTEDDMVILFRLLPRQLAADVFSELNTDAQMTLLQQLSNNHIQDIISELPPDDRTEIFGELPAKITRRLLNLLSPEDRKESLKLLGYPENSVGRLMTPDYVAIHPYWTVSQSLEHIRKFGHDAETFNIIYVVDETWHLVGAITLRKLILASPQQTIESIMTKDILSISPFDDQEKAVQATDRYDLYVLPVVDSETTLLGIVTVDDILDVSVDEFTEDAQKAGGIVPLEIDYSSASIWTLYSKRIIWLSLLAVSGFLSGSVISAFDETIAALVVLAFFIPVLIGTGGNTGTQSATLIIRAIATGDLTLQKWFSAIKKEVFVGLVLGVTLGIIFYFWSYLWKGMPVVAVIVSMSVFAITLWANLLGSLLPIVLTKLKLDPAVVSAPLISTLMDATGLTIYFTIATWLLKIWT